jgi:site-specific DNA-methyltransferase (adenine-specific)
MIELNRGDCLEIMKDIPDESVDMILCDLPYGISASSWDKQLPMDLLWEEYKRIIKPNRAIVLFSQQPFTSLLITSNIEMWKYNWIWEKDNGTNFMNSHHQPLKITEDICVFGIGATSYVKSGEYLIYNPQFTDGKPYSIVSGKQKENSAIVRNKREEYSGFKTENKGVRFPKNLIKFIRDKDKLHPTQKPVALLEYLIKTYTNEGEIVLDNCMGSGSTGVACVNTNRNFIGIELDEEYFNIARQRIDEAKGE